MTSIGIDFGTSYCCVAIHRNGKTEVIPNEHDQRLTLSYIAFTEDERLFGDAAQHQTPLNLKNTLYQIKSLVGRTSDDDIVRKHEKYWGFDVNHNSSKNEIEIPITFRGKDFKLNPVQVTAMIFENLKEMAKNYIGEKVDNAVISVPACFNGFQRNAIRDAAFVSGFKNVKLLEEPRAAALAFAENQNNSKERVVLVFDIGSGKFDTGIYVVKNGNKLHKLGETGNPSFGGEDFDSKLVDYILQDNRNITPDKKIIYRLKASCEKAKKSLSAAKRARLHIDRFVGDESYTQVLMVDEFENVTQNKFEEIEKVLLDLLRDAKTDKSQVDDIVLVGGSTRIPKIRKILSNFFGKGLNQTVNPDEAVACGAAIYAENWFKNSEAKEDPPPHSVDIENMIQQNAVFSQEDEDLRLLNEKRNELENYIYQNYVKSSVKSSSNNEIGQEEETLFLEHCDKTLIWLGEHQDAAILDEVERRLSNLKRAVGDMQQPKRPSQEDEVHKLSGQKQPLEQEIEDEPRTKEAVSVQSVNRKIEDIEDNRIQPTSKITPRGSPLPLSAHGANGQKSYTDINQCQSKPKVAGRRTPLGVNSKAANSKSTPENQFQRNSVIKKKSKDAALHKANERFSEPERRESSSKGKRSETPKRANKGSGQMQYREPNRKEMNKNKKPMSAQSTNRPKTGIGTGQSQPKATIPSPSYSPDVTKLQPKHNNNTKYTHDYETIGPDGKARPNGTHMKSNRHKSTLAPLRNDVDYEKKRIQQDLENLVCHIKGELSRYNKRDKGNLSGKCNQVENWLENGHTADEYTEKWNSLHKYWRNIQIKNFGPQSCSGWKN